MSILDDDRVIKAVHAAAKRVENISRGYLERADLVNHLYLWLMEHDGKAAEYVESGGVPRLQGVMERRCLGYVAEERKLRTGDPRGEGLAYYNPGMVEDLLPDIWYYSTWDFTGTAAENEDVRRGQAKPAEGNTRLAALADVSGAVMSLSDEDKAFLRLRYCDGGNTWDEVGLYYQVTGEAARKRGERIIGRIIDRLGGPAPWWTPSRRSKSNASAQSDLRRTDG